MPEAYSQTPIWRYRQGALENTPESTLIVREHAATLIVNGELWLTFICSPIALEALAIGFLFNENVITSLEEVENVTLTDEDRRIEVKLTHPTQKPAQFHRTSTGVSLQPHLAARKVGADFSIQAGKVIALDKNFALEKVTASDVLVDSDKLIDRQLERSAISCIAGFAKIFEEASKVLEV